MWRWSRENEDLFGKGGDVNLDKDMDMGIVPVISERWRASEVRIAIAQSKIILGDKRYDPQSEHLTIHHLRSAPWTPFPPKKIPNP